MDYIYLKIGEQNFPLLHGESADYFTRLDFAGELTDLEKADIIVDLIQNGSPTETMREKLINGEGY